MVDVSGIARWLLRNPTKEASMLAERRQLAVLLDAAACVRLACYTLLSTQLQWQKCLQALHK